MLGDASNQTDKQISGQQVEKQTPKEANMMSRNVAHKDNLLPQPLTGKP